jgi:hypothetical protein
MAKYKIYWEEFTTSTGKELREEMKDLPNPKIIGKEGDRTTIACRDSFSAKNDAEAKKYVEDNYYGVWGEGNGLSVTKNGKEVFTEEDVGGH